MNAQELKVIDPVRKQSEHGVGALSPMDPPEAYAPPALDPVPPSQMHSFLRTFVDEHQVLMEELRIFEETIVTIQKHGFTKELDGTLRHFFQFYEKVLVPHERREARQLFPLLNKRLIAEGEHSPGETPTTAIDLMDDDHSKAGQLAAVILNFMGLAFRLPDERSKLLVLDAALEQGKNLVELLHLHIFREDNVIFPAAHRLITGVEFDELQSKAVTER